MTSNTTLHPASWSTPARDRRLDVPRDSYDSHDAQEGSTQCISRWQGANLLRRTPATSRGHQPSPRECQPPSNRVPSPLREYQPSPTDASHLREVGRRAEGQRHKKGLIDLRWKDRLQYHLDCDRTLTTSFYLSPDSIHSCREDKDPPVNPY